VALGADDHLVCSTARHCGICAEAFLAQSPFAGFTHRRPSNDLDRSSGNRCLHTMGLLPALDADAEAWHFLSLTPSSKKCYSDSGGRSFWDLTSCRFLGLATAAFASVMYCALFPIAEEACSCRLWHAL